MKNKHGLVWNLLAFAGVTMLVLAVISAKARAQAVVDSSTLQGKVLFGYQGWFGCAGDGSSNRNWRSWARGTPAAKTLTIDMYPDLRELDPDERYPVPNMTIGGKPAFLYSANNRKTVLRHFQWMKEYGLDGVLVQRFLGSTRGKRNSGDVVLKNVMAGAEKYGRTFAIEYDLTGGNPDTFFQTLRGDWQYLVDDLKVTSHPNYLHHQGKPVLSVWGMGLTEDRHVPKDPEIARQVIEWFQTKAPKTYQVTYMGGTPSRWRTLTNDCRKDPRWTEAFRKMDVIQPWTVGRYRDNNTVDQWKTNMLQPDLAWTATNGSLYMPVIFPGFSWHNLKREAPKNAIPRNRGEFLWRQAFNAKEAGAVMLKIAMFDEVNEGTAMFKLAARRSDAPDQGYWLTLDADGYDLPSDWYLRIAGEITRMFHGEVAPTPNLPEKLGPPRKAELEKPASVRSAAVSKPDGKRDEASPLFEEAKRNWPCFRGTGDGFAT
ncbi:MAG: glycoside hydrolase family 71/99-like protein [Verrucomicrobia bacterium]|nr:glycoside hydrolase family 71/99-like protein [Verrucomicrobiota bacterium]